MLKTPLQLKKPLLISSILALSGTGLHAIARFFLQAAHIDENTERDSRTRSFKNA